MKRLFEFIRKERLYLLLFIFVLLVTAIIMMPLESERKQSAAKVKVGLEKKEPVEDLAKKREEVEELFTENRDLALVFSLTSLLILLLLCLGIAVDLILLSSRLGKKELDIHTYKPQGQISWGVWDVCRVVILFMFFGYMLIIIESSLIRIFPLVKNDNFRMILNSTILDTLGVVFIIYFTVGQYKEKFVSLGISFKNFFRNIFYGMVGYIALIPILVVLLLAIAYISNLIKYVPEKQPVVELFLKEKNAPLLIYTSLFAAIAGPIIEELFFRGFMYNAFKKYIGIFWATLITAAMFAALHAHIVGFLPILALGMMLAYLYEKTGTLVSSITVHMIHNLSMVLLVFLVKQIGAY